MPAFSKPYEMLIHARISSFFQKHDIINKNQFGFQPKSNTTSATVNLINNIQYCLDQKSLICSAIFIDISKAFDCVPHAKLLDKFHKYGIRGNAHLILQSYLGNRKQTVNIDEFRSSTEVPEFGVAQGSILGPFLFIGYINDIFDVPLKGSIQLYADDAVIVYSATNVNELYRDMQEDLNLIYLWFCNNGLTVNASKSSHMIFSSTNRFQNITNELRLGNEKLQRVESTIYLGLTIQQNLKWNDHVDHVCSKLAKFLGMLRHSSYLLSIKERKDLYYAHVHSHVTYLNIIWQRAPEYATNRISILLNKYMRIIFWEQYNRLNVRTIELYRRNRFMNFNQIRYFEAVLFMYRVKHNLIKNNNQIQHNNEIHRYQTRTASDIRVTAPRTNYIRLGCMYTAAVNYNNLPLNIKTQTPLSRFKRSLKQYILDFIQ